MDTASKVITTSVVVAILMLAALGYADLAYHLIFLGHI